MALDRMAASRGLVPSLDGLRAVSISIVLLAHFVSEKIFPGGLGVYVFFVISGFLITRLLIIEHETTNGVSLPLFYARRLLRLYPVMIVFALAMLGFYAALGRPVNLLEPAAALGYFANYLYLYLQMHDIPGQLPFGVFWSLSVEEHFYILFPLAFVLLKGHPERLMWLLIGLCTTCLGLRLGMAWLHPEYLDTETFYFQSQYRLDSIGFGVILALACQMKRGRRLLQALAHPVAAATALAVLLACLVVRDAWLRETFRYTVLGAAIDVLLAAVLFGRHYGFLQRVLNTAILTWIGRLSYSLYVWHLGTSSLLPLGGLAQWQAAVISLTASFAVAAASYYVVELPFLSLRRYVRVTRPQPAVFLQTDKAAFKLEMGA